MTKNIFTASFPLIFFFMANSYTYTEGPSSFTEIHYGKFIFSYFFRLNWKIEPISVTWSIYIIMKKQTKLILNFWDKRKIATLKSTVKDKLMILILKRKLLSILSIDNKIVISKIFKSFNWENICVKHFLIEIIVKFIIN